MICRKIAITKGNAGYSTATASGGSHGFQHSGHQRSSTVDFSGEWELSLGSNTARMVPPTVKQAGAVSAWRKEEISRFRERNREHAKNHNDAFGSGSYYCNDFVPKIDDVQSYGNCQSLEYQLKPSGDNTTLYRELNGFMQQKSLRGPLIALPSKNIKAEEKINDKDAHGKQRPLVTSYDGSSYENTVTISKVGKCADLSKVRANLRKIYNRVRVVDNVSTAKEIVAKLINQYRNLVHACDTEVCDHAFAFTLLYSKP